MQTEAKSQSICSSVTLDELDIRKLEILKKRYGYSKNVEMIRYLLTCEVEKVFDKMDEQEKVEKLGKAENKIKEHAIIHNEENSANSSGELEDCFVSAPIYQ